MPAEIDVEAHLRRPAPHHDQADELVAWLRRATGWDAVVAIVDRALGRTRQRELEAELAAAHAEIERLRSRLADVTRPPVQFARMREREGAVDRLARLRLARRPKPEESLLRR